jgi:hypothetical protein
MRSKQAKAASDYLNTHTKYRTLNTTADYPDHAHCGRWMVTVYCHQLPIWIKTNDELVSFAKANGFIGAA